MDGKNWISIKDSGLLSTGMGRKFWLKTSVTILFSTILLSLIFYFAGSVGFLGWSLNNEPKSLEYFDWGVEGNNTFQKGATILLSITGEVNVKDDGEEKFAVAKEKQILLPGARIETGEEGEAVVLFSNGTSLAVGKKTNFSVKMFGQKEFNASKEAMESVVEETSPSRINLDLEIGELVVVVKKLNRDSSLVVSSSLAFAGVRGTSFSINAQEDSTSVNVLSGQVDFLNLDKMSKLVNAGKSARSTELDLTLNNQIPQADSERIEEMEKKVKLAIREISVSELKKSFDQVNPKLGWCDPIIHENRLLASGGTKKVSQAIKRGIEWLVSMQLEDGSWGENDRDDQGNPKKTDAKAMTGMAVICLLQNCDNDLLTRNNAALKKAIEYLTAIPVSEVKSGPDSYSHPIYTRALIKAFAKLKIPELEELATKLVSTIVRGQNKNGGWAYGYGKGAAAHVDLSVTGWNVMALADAKSFGLRVNGLDAAIARSMEYVKKCQDSLGKFAYQAGNKGKPSLTGMGVHCLQLGNYGDSSEAERGLNWLLENLPSDSEEFNFYGMRHASKAYFTATSFGKIKYWRAFNQKITKLLIDLQRVDGSWQTARHFHGDSDLFRTTLALDALQTYYMAEPGLIR